MDLPDFWTAVAAIATATQTLVVILALLYAIRQTRQLGKQISLTQITTTRDRLQRVNELLLRPENASLSESVGESRATAFVSILLNQFETWYELHEAQLLTEAEWKADYAVIRDFMRRPIMWRHWIGDPETTPEQRDPHRHYYDEAFQRLIDCALPDEIRRKAGLTCTDRKRRHRVMQPVAPNPPVHTPRDWIHLSD